MYLREGGIRLILRLRSQVAKAELGKLAGYILKKKWEVYLSTSLNFYEVTLPMAVVQGGRIGKTGLWQ